MNLVAGVELGALCLEYAPRMLAWMLDAEVAVNVGIAREPTYERTCAWLESAGPGACAILFHGSHVGNVVLDLIDPHLGTARLSIYVGEADARGAGVGRTATWLACQRGFEELNLYKVWLTVHAENARARAAYEAVGFKVEGVLRGEFLLDGRRVDAVRMGLLRGELA